jgi:hypothetical protein
MAKTTRRANQPIAQRARGRAAKKARSAEAPERNWLALGDRKMDARPDALDIRDLPYRPRLRTLPDHFPDEQDVATYLERYKPYVLDQGNEGACTGFGLAAVINYLRWSDWERDRLIGKARSAPEKVSERMLYEAARLYDEWDGEDYDGSSCRGAMKGWHKHGVTLAELWPYVSKKGFQPPKPGWEKAAVEVPLGAYFRIDQREIVDMQSAIVETGAIYVSCDTHAGWDEVKAVKQWEDAVIRQKGRKTEGGHAFAIVGYGRRGFVVQNSWGLDWGYSGFALLPYEDWLANGSDVWVAALGAPIDLPRGSPAAKVSRSLVQQAKTGAAPAASPAKIGRARSTELPTGPGFERWSDDQVGNHMFVIGNDGLPRRHLLVREDGSSSLVKTVTDRVDDARNAKLKHVVIYAHGGLNEEAAGLATAMRLGPLFHAHGIMPLFPIWRTGFGESLLNIVEKSVASILPEAWSRRQATGPLDGLRDWFKDVFEEARERIDITIEQAAHAGPGRAIWSLIKSNAVRSGEASDGAMSLFARTLANALQGSDIKVHLVGHSAGAILLGAALKPLAARGVPIASARLYAPACSVAFANDTWGKALADGVIGPGQLHVDLLTDEREREDTVASIYSKSLLYLVMRGCEEVRKSPLLGLERAWGKRIEKALEHGTFDGRARADLETWNGIADRYRVKLHLMSEPKAVVARWRDKVVAIDSAHGSFDNDLDIVGQTISTISGKSVPALQANLSDDIDAGDLTAATVALRARLMNPARGL